MFTGIVTDKGEIVETDDAEGRRITVRTRYDLGGVEIGASICHAGVCLTVTEKGEDWYRVQASGETLRLTTLGEWRAGDRVNLERSLRLGDELGGHIVFGHVDGLGTVSALDAVGESWRLEVRTPAELAPLIAVKGSIAVDGVSLTVNEAAGDRFAVNVIPHTWQATTLSGLKPGDRVNLEADMLARYVARQTAFLAAARG